MRCANRAAVEAGCAISCRAMRIRGGVSYVRMVGAAHALAGCFAARPVVHAWPCEPRFTSRDAAVPVEFSGSSRVARAAIGLHVGATRTAIRASRRAAICVVGIDGLACSDRDLAILSTKRCIARRRLVRANACVRDGHLPSRDRRETRRVRRRMQRRARICACVRHSAVICGVIDREHRRGERSGLPLSDTYAPIVTAARTDSGCAVTAMTRSMFAEPVAAFVRDARRAMRDV